MNKFIKLCEYLLFIMFIVLIFFMSSKFSFLLIIPIFILLWLFVKKVKIKRFGLFIFILALITRLISVFYLRVSILDDFKVMYSASKSLINNDLSFLSTPYFQTFSYQFGHVLYQSFLLKIFNSVIFLKIVNCLITSSIILFIYLIGKKLFNENIGRISSLLYIFYLYPLYLNSVLTNQHLPALIVLIVIYLLISKEYNYKLFIFIGLLLSISNIFRTEAIIIVMGIIIYNICLSNKKNMFKYFSYSLILVVCYFSFNFIFNFLIHYNYNIYLKNNSPEWKFYCGLNDKYNGIYNEEDQNEYFNGNDTHKLLVDRIKNEYIKFPVLFLKKEVILWTQTNYDIQITNNINNKILSFMYLFNQGVLNFSYILFIISLFPKKFKKSSGVDKTLLIKIILGLYFGVYMFIEISPRYAYILNILMFLIIGFGIERVYNLSLKIKKEL